jgi:hypothetical protein
MAAGFIFCGGLKMAAWIKSQDDIWEHHKTLKLCATLKISRPLAVGHLHALWHFSLRNAWKNANLEPWGEAGIASVCYWEGDPNVFITALRECGFLDGFVVHGWIERAGKLVTDRQYNELRKTNAVKRRIDDVNVRKTLARGRGRGRVDKSTDTDTCLSVLQAFNSACDTALKLTPTRKTLILQRLKDGHTLEDMTTAIKNFSQDDWPDRNKFLDLVYAIGVRKGTDNLDRWLNFKPQSTKTTAAENEWDALRAARSPAHA